MYVVGPGSVRQKVALKVTHGNTSSGGGFDAWPQNCGHRKTDRDRVAERRRQEDRDIADKNAKVDRANDMRGGVRKIEREHARRRKKRRTLNLIERERKA
jgi:hypothetical protein